MGLNSCNCSVSNFNIKILIKVTRDLKNYKCTYTSLDYEIVKNEKFVLLLVLNNTIKINN